MYIRVPQSHLCTLMQDNAGNESSDDEKQNNAGDKKKGDDPDR